MNITSSVFYLHGKLQIFFILIITFDEILTRNQKKTVLNFVIAKFQPRRFLFTNLKRNVGYFKKGQLTFRFQD